MVDIAHFAGLVAGGAHPSPFPRYVVTTTTHNDPARPARRHDPHERRGSGEEDQFGDFSRPPGRPLMHVIAAKAVALGEARPEFKLYARAVVENAKALADILVSAGYVIVAGGTDNHLMLVDLRPKGLTGKAAEASRSAAHIPATRTACRSTREADRDLGHPPRDPGGDLPGLRCRRIPAGRRTHRRDPRWARAERRGRQRRRRGQRPGARTRPDPPFPDLRLTIG